MQAYLQKGRIKTMSIKKAVIPCGVMGTRFLPITKAVPKEILPVIDTPVLGHIVNEAIDSGITDILIILGKGKEAIKSYFTPDLDLEKKLRDKGNDVFADIVKKIGGNARISFEVQQKPLGSGDALLYAEKFVAGEPSLNRENGGNSTFPFFSEHSRYPSFRIHVGGRSCSLE